jgi:hypothetical protein
MAWNPSDDQLEDLKRGWTVDGLSAGQLASHFGQTRNVIIGIIHRRAWPKAGGDTTRTHQPRAPAAPKPPRPPKAEPKPARTATVIDDPSQHVALDQLGPHHCRYPVGEAGKYCGQRPNGSPYCDGHARIVYQPQQPGKIKRPR